MSEKTEYPTSKKLRQAREDGQVAHSKDFTQTALILALFGYMLGSSDDIIKTLSQMILLPTDVMGMNFEEAVNTLATKLFNESVKLLAPFLLIVVLGVVTAGGDRVVDLVADQIVEVLEQVAPVEQLMELDLDGR